MVINKLNHISMERIMGNKVPLYILISGICILTRPGGSYAADWIISPGVELRHTYTDNALLVNENSVSDKITVLRPSLSAYKEGNRATLDFNYAPEYRYYWDETHDNETVHFLRSKGNIEIAENHLFLDGWANADRTNITSAGRTGIQGLTGTQDDTEFYTVGLSPYFTAKLGDFSVVELRVTGDKVDYSENIGNDSTGRRGEIAFGNGSMFTNQIWEVLYQQSSVDYENQEDDNEVKLFRAELIQKLTHQWAVAFSAGYEDYNLAVNEDRDDSTWSIGGIYTPNPRTRIALGVGERSYGDDYYFDFTHRSSRTIWTATYKQDYVSARDELGTRPLFERQDAFGNLVRDPILESSASLVRSGSSPTISEDYYESKRFITEFTYQTDRSSLSLRGRYHKRDYDYPETDTTETELALMLSRRLTRLMTGYLQIVGIDHKEDPLSYDQRTGTLGMAYQFGHDSRFDFSIARLKRDADIDTGSYDVNYASASVRTQF